ncbi:unnamed protein product [Gongylonema pulchrum]|uniref:ZP domain-containing protein n=1 Tax=Gongylonema pulchrum TaxID=637853 RepID=A0A183DBJ5_9BILA|nr:unnamed protein product [Gongylonema pulchrum]
MSRERGVPHEPLYVPVWNYQYQRYLRCELELPTLSSSGQRFMSGYCFYWNELPGQFSVHRFVLNIIPEKSCVTDYVYC